MGIAYQLVSGRVTNPGAALTAVTVNTGDSLQIPKFSDGSMGLLEQIWVHAATPLQVRVRSPRLHDNAQGIRLTVPESAAKPLLPDEADQPVVSIDTLIVELNGGGAETDVAVLALWYADLSGSDQKLALWEQVKPRIKHMLTNEVDCTAPATIGNWNAGNPLTLNFDQLHANSKYAILGYEVNASCAAVAIAGPDTSNLRVGGPGTLDSRVTRDWFVRQSIQTGRPHIPIFDAANKGATNVFTLSASAPAAINVGLILAELTD
jgi:hypothetical protein